MITGKYTCIYNMLSWYSSRNILCLLKTLTLLPLGVEGGKKGGLAGWACFSILTLKILRLVALTIYFDRLGGKKKNLYDEITGRF